jgi:peptidoglycan/LPS O-acetylase OafA/YrhL
VDVVRLLTFAAVISVHSLAFTEQPDSRTAAGATMLLKFGREVFFSLTGFVLVHSVTNGRRPIGRFWGKRMLYEALSYTIWSGVYYAYSVIRPQPLRPSLSGFERLGRAGVHQHNRTAGMGRVGVHSGL